MHFPLHEKDIFKAVLGRGDWIEKKKKRKEIDFPNGLGSALFKCLIL